jgi:hypothetical protein
MRIFPQKDICGGFCVKPGERRLGCLIATNIISACPEMEGSSQKGNAISKLLAASLHNTLMFNSRAANYLLLCSKYTSLKNLWG